MLFYFLLAITFSTSIRSVSGYSSNNAHEFNIDLNSSESNEVKLISWRWPELGNFFIIIFFIMLIVLFKIILEQIPHISQFVPESCILLIIGLLYGCFFKFSSRTLKEFFHLKSELFFEFLLPPIILEAAYGLHNTTFYRNIVKIAMFAVVGTVLNASIITASIYGVISANLTSSNISQSMDIKQVSLFSSFIVAVDPVAVLAIFQEIGVNPSLYFLVFGESLFNDAVTVVLYSIAQTFARQTEIQPVQYLMGFLSFFTISFGGIFIGCVWGVMSCFVTRFSHNLESFEPLIVMLFAYAAYLNGDLLGWSGIMSIIFCGLIQVAYAFHNITQKSVITVKRIVRMLTHLSEASIFLFLGIELFNDVLFWDGLFITWAVILTLLARLIVVPLLCLLLRLIYVSDRKQHISYRDQFIMIYGGLRGAVAYALAATIKHEALASHSDPASLKGLFLSTTLVIVLITNLLNGITMKPLVKLLKLQSANSNKKWSLFKEFNRSVMAHTMRSVEGIINQHGGSLMLNWGRHFDERYVRPLLQREPWTHDEKIVLTYEKIAMALHMANVRPNRSETYLGKLSSLVQNSSKSMLLHSGIWGVESGDDKNNNKNIFAGDDLSLQKDLPLPDDSASLLKIRPKSISIEPRNNFFNWDLNNYSVSAINSRTLPVVVGKDIFKHCANKESLKILTESRYDDLSKTFNDLLRRRHIYSSKSEDIHHHDPPPSQTITISFPHPLQSQFNVPTHASDGFKEEIHEINLRRNIPIDRDPRKDATKVNFMIDSNEDLSQLRRKPKSKSVSHEADHENDIFN